MKPKSKQNVGTSEDFLQKPFTDEELLDFVKQQLTDE
jgi:FixJ family two-component response regulator